MEMEEKMALMKVLLFLTVTIHLSSAACSRIRHLQFNFAENTAEALLDGERFVYYEKSQDNFIPTTEWMKRNYKREALTDKLNDGLQCALDFVGTAVSSFSRTEGYQLMYGCKLDKGIESGYWKFGYDGEYFLSLNLNDGNWTAVNEESKPIKQKMEKEGSLQKAFLQDECIPWLKEFISYKDSLSRHRRSAEENACSAPEKHSLWNFYTGVTGINFPEFTAVGMVDGEQFVHYDSNTREERPKTEWIKKVVGDDAGYWDTQTKILQGWEETFKVNLQTAMQRFNQTKGVHTVQMMYGCELDEDGTKRGYEQYGYDGKDFLVLDLTTVTWVAPVSQAVLTKQKWDRAGDATYTKTYLETTCIEWLQKYVGNGKSERKVPPEVSVFQKDSSSPVVCHTTGFFPRAVMISWQKNGEDLNEDVELRETLPNQDGTFQKRSILTVSAEELKNNQYTCVVQHSSLEKELVRNFESDGGMGVIIGAVVAVLLLVLIAVGVGVGVVVLKTKKSGFKFVPVNPNGSTDGENSSTNS